MIVWLDWAMLALVKVGGVIWLVGAVAQTAYHTCGWIGRVWVDANELRRFAVWRYGYPKDRQGTQGN